MSETESRVTLNLPEMGHVRTEIKTGGEWQPVRPMHWISVKERLPEYPDDVLVYDSQAKDVYKVFGLSRNAKGELTHIDDDENGKTGDYVLYNVTHWMPLPEPPGEG